MASENWDKHYRKIAKEIAGKSKEKPSSRRVGAVLVRDNRIIATGFNGLPTSVTDTPERLQNKEIKQDMVVHAEMNALIVAGERAKEATIYVHGKPVCARCAASLIQAGITRVVSPKPLTELEVLAKQKINMENNPEEPPAHEQPGFVDWEKSGRIAREMFEETNIAFNAYDRSRSKIQEAIDADVEMLRSVLKDAAQPKKPQLKSKLKVAE